MAFGHLCTKIHYNQNAADKGVRRLKRREKMSRRGIIVCAFAVFSLFSGGAKAETTEQMLSACSPVANARVSGEAATFLQNFDTGLCWGAFSVIQSNIVHIDGDGKRLYEVCAPSESTLTQLVSIFSVYAKNNPHKMHQDFFSVALESLQKAFPC